MYLFFKNNVDLCELFLLFLFYLQALTKENTAFWWSQNDKYEIIATVLNNHDHIMTLLFVQQNEKTLW